MTSDAARPIAALERKIREVTGAAFKTYNPAAHGGCHGMGGAYGSTRMVT
jgi:hypothetical protein